MFDHDDTGNRKVFSRRLLIAGALSGAGFAALGWRFFDLQIRNAGLYTPLAENNRIKMTVLAPKRGRILDRAGVEIVGNRQTFRANIVPALAGDVSRVIQAFRDIVPLDSAAMERIATRLKRQSRNDAVMMVGNLTFEQVAKINVNAPYLPGVKTEVVWKREYAAGAALGHVVGYVGYPTDEQAAADPVLRLPGVRVGKIGLEKGFELPLRGRGGVQRVEVNARGGIVRDLGAAEPVDGSDLVLTLNRDLQARITERLSVYTRCACVVIDTASGDIAALASHPGYDPADIADGISEADWARLAESPDKPLLNRATAGVYEPGAVFHVVTAIAGLDSEAITDEEKITCSGTFDLNGKTVACGPPGRGHGAVDVASALAVSCRHFFAEVGKRTGATALTRAAEQLGLGERHQLNMPPQKVGAIASRRPSSVGLPLTWTDDAASRAGLGYGGTLVTPLQLAVLGARLVSGLRLHPKLARMRNTTETAVSPSPLRLSSADVRHVYGAVKKTSLSTGVGANGNAVRAIAGIGAVSPASSVNTAANVAEPDDTDDTGPQDTTVGHGATTDQDHALFVGFVDEPKPRFVVAVVVENGADPQTTARPLAADILRMTAETFADRAAVQSGAQRG